MSAGWDGTLALRGGHQVHNSSLFPTGPCRTHLPLPLDDLLGTASGRQSKAHWFGDPGASHCPHTTSRG